jgi:hypothetical protein
MEGGPGVLAEVVFRSQAECGRWYPPRPPWGGVHTYLVSVCLEGGTCPVLVRVVDGPRVAAGEPGRFVLVPLPEMGGGELLQPGARFSLLDARYRPFVGSGHILERLARTPIPPGDADRADDHPPAAPYGPPTRLRIARDEHRFTNVGRRADGTQFMAYVVGAFPVGWRSRTRDWRKVKRWQAVAHYLDGDGRHLRTDVRLGGVEADRHAANKAFQHLTAIYNELTVGGEPDYGDIWAQLFSINIDGILYELRYERRASEEGGADETVTFLPMDVVFAPPWDRGGGYST